MSRHSSTQTKYPSMHHSKAAATMALCIFIAFSAYGKSAEGKKQSKTQTSDISYAHDARVQQFAMDVALRRDLDPDAIKAVLAQARKLPQARNLICRPKRHRRKTGLPTARGSSSPYA